MRKPSSPRRLLKEAIQDYSADVGKNLKCSDRKFLLRFAISGDATQAFARLHLKDRISEAILFDACVEAHHIHLNFKKLLKEQQSAVERTKRWDQATLVLQKFHAEMANQRHSPILNLAGLDIWPASLSSPPVTHRDFKRALDLIVKAIAWRQYVAKQNIANLGVTRDCHTEEASANSAIWILAAGVYDSSRNRPSPGKPHVPEIVLLARTILQTDTITSDRVRSLLRNRRQLWLKQFGRQTGHRTTKP